MFKIRETKIVSSPVEEPVLEVIEEPQLQQVVAMDFVTVRGNVKYIYYGIVTDYDGIEYEFEWDSQNRRLCRLIGSQVTELMWFQTSTLLEQQFPEIQDNTEVNIVSVLEQNNKQLISKLDENIKSIDSRLEQLSRSSDVRQPMIIKSEEVPQLSLPDFSSQFEEQDQQEASNRIDEDDITRRAQEFLKQSRTDSLDIDYLSLTE